MKHLKKLTALILAVCMLIGMPLSLDVSATGRPDSGEYAMPLQLTQAISIPAEWNTGLVAERSVALYFTGDVTIDTANTKAYITLINDAGLAAYVDPVNGKKKSRHRHLGMGCHHQPLHRSGLGQQLRCDPQRNPDPQRP